jgi:hypothetical protein
MTKIFPLLTLLPALLFAAAWDGTANTSWYTSNPNAATYTISTAEELAGLAALVNGGNTFQFKTIKLGANIVLNDTTGWQNWNESTSGLKSWTPIGGNSSNSFKGNFDGNGKAIIGLYGTDGGLFGYASGTISNLGLAGFYVKGENVGGIVSNTIGDLQILDSYAIGNVVGSGRTGGIVGNVYYDSFLTISNTYVIGNVTGGIYYTGGIVGGYGGGGISRILTISNTYVIGNVTSSGTTGGIIGEGGSVNNEFIITNSYVKGNVTGNDRVGGIVGTVTGRKSTITNSYCFGNVTTDNSNAVAGGIIGYAFSNDGVTITNAYVIGNVISSNGYAGGIVGQHSASINTQLIITKTYVSGDVTGNTVGGIVPAGQYIYVTNSFYNSNIASDSYGIPKTDEEMKNIITYLESDWDFNSIWAVNPSVNNGYPFFQNSIYTKGKKPIAQASYIPSVVESYTNSPIEPVVDGVTYEGTKLIKGTDYDLLYRNNVSVGSDAEIIIMGKGDYYGIKIVNFHITNQKRSIANVIVEPIFQEQITGDSIKPKPVVKDFNNEVTLREGKDYALEYSDNKYAGQAVVKISGIGIYEGSRTVNFSIVGRIPLTVQWSEKREFVYNKMVQHPPASIEEAEDLDIQWRVVNARSEAGEYTDANKLAPFVIITSANANSFELLNNTVDYKITKKSLKPYFSATLNNFETSESTDTLWVPREVFADSAALRSVLNSLIDYDGFARDTIENKSDNMSVLKGRPEVSFEYKHTVSSINALAKRVETTQTAVAVINTDGVSADNYILAKPTITIMETVEEGEELAKKIFCYRGNFCTMLSEQVCSFVEGTEVSSCTTLRKSCLITDSRRCIENLLLSECRDIGGTAIETCETTPIISSNHSPTNQMHVWQTASGVVNVDLGYMPAKPVAVQIYDLKGKLVTTGEAGTRFASVRLNAGGGVYLFKVGNRSLVKVLK